MARNHATDRGSGLDIIKDGHRRTSEDGSCSTGARVLKGSAHARLINSTVSTTLVPYRLIACRSDLSCHHFNFTPRNRRGRCRLRKCPLSRHPSCRLAPMLAIEVAALGQNRPSHPRILVRQCHRRNVLAAASGQAYVEFNISWPGGKVSRSRHGAVRPPGVLYQSPGVVGSVLSAKSDAKVAADGIFAPYRGW